ncbi:MAG: hypothetical protein N2C12_14180, partial [Planctomycetales bacterium]
VCGGEAFHWFTAHLLAHLPRLHEIYNSSAAEYRRVHRLRSQAHPVPDLGTEGEWLEAPFWIWSVQDPHRRRLICRVRGDELLLSDGHGLELPLSLSPDMDADSAVNQLSEAASRGIKIRTRALITTMFARLFPADLFVHGIGGARYDQLTDMLIRRFFELEPPGYLTLSGTLKLPVTQTHSSIEDLRRVHRELRDLKFNPDRFLLYNGNTDQVKASAMDWIENKRQWIDTEQTVDNARLRFEQIRDSNQALQLLVADQASRLRLQQEKIEQQLRAEAIISSRDSAFCLHQKSILTDYLLDIMPKSL